MKLFAPMRTTMAAPRCPARPRARGRSWLLACALAATGCDSFGSFCADEAECEGGNEADQEACAIELEVYEDRAAARACEKDFEAYFECLESDVQCQGELFDRTPCDPDFMALQECLQ